MYTYFSSILTLMAPEFANRVNGVDCAGLPNCHSETDVLANSCSVQAMLKSCLIAS